jgi:hypothetical protein
MLVFSLCCCRDGVISACIMVAVKHAPLIEANRAFATANFSRPAHVKSSKEDSGQCWIKWHRFATLNVLGCLCNFVIKPPEKL